jgi:hypothetical protein
MHHVFLLHFAAGRAKVIRIEGYVDDESYQDDWTDRTPISLRLEFWHKPELLNTSL